MYISAFFPFISWTNNVCTIRLGYPQLRQDEDCGWIVNKVDVFVIRFIYIVVLFSCNPKMVSSIGRRSALSDDCDKILHDSRWLPVLPRQTVPIIAREV